MKRLFYLLLGVVFAACDSIEIPPDEGGGDIDGNVTLSFSTYGQQPFTRGAEALQGQVTRLGVAVFNGEGKRVKSVSQTTATSGFGTVSLSLAAGEYTVLAVGHNSSEGNATLSSPEKVTFASNKVTDTFAYLGTLAVGEDPVEETLEMTRRVAMVRFTLTDAAVPASRLKFFYTGGSSTYNPTLGYGCVNSRQTEYRDCRDAAGNVVRVFEIYTLPHEETDVLKVTVTPMASDGSAMDDVVFESVPVQRNKITTWQGSLFGGGDGGGDDDTPGGGITFTLNAEWDGVIRIDN